MHRFCLIIMYGYESQKIISCLCCMFTGTIDGKHIVMVCPSNSGSNYYNHKGTFSIVLLALVGHNYNFSFIDIGSYGSNSDAGIFAKSALKRALEENKLDMIPESVILGEEAFLLQTYLMTPFARRNILTKREKIYNYRHCRARRIVENAFGIFRQPIPLPPDKTIKLVKAACALHNWIRKTVNSSNLYQLTLKILKQEVL